MFPTFLITIFVFANVNGDCDVCSRNIKQCDYYKNQYNQITQDYDKYFNSSRAMYQECVTELDSCYDQLMDNMEDSDMYMKSLDQFHTTNKSYDQEKNSLMKKNLQLESSMFNMNKTLTNRINDCSERLKTAYTIMEDFKQNNTNLKNMLNSLKLKVDMGKIDLKNCDEKVQAAADEILKHRENEENLVQHVNNCVDREEICQEKKTRYSVSLNACRNQKRNLKIRCQKRQ